MQNKMRTNAKKQDIVQTLLVCQSFMYLGINVLCELLGSFFCLISPRLPGRHDTSPGDSQLKHVSQHLGLLSMHGSLPVYQCLAHAGSHTSLW